MSLSDPKPGGWIDHEVLTHLQMNAIRTELLKAIDGVGGGTYNLTAPLILAGDTVRFDEQAYINFGATLEADGDVNIRSGSTLQCKVGSALLVRDNATFEGASVFDGSSFRFSAGMPVHVEDPTDIVVDSYVATLEVPLIQVPSAGAANWLFDPLGNGGWLNTSIGTLETYFVLPVNPGDVITNVRLQVVGGAGAGHGGVDPSTKMRIRLYESPARGSGGGYTNLFSVTDPATGAAYDARHNLTISAGYTALTRVYLVGVRSETGGTAASGENLIERLYVDIVKNQLSSTSLYMSA